MLNYELIAEALRDLWQNGGSINPLIDLLQEEAGMTFPAAKECCRRLGSLIADRAISARQVETIIRKMTQ